MYRDYSSDTSYDYTNEYTYVLVSTTTDFTDAVPIWTGNYLIFTTEWQQANLDLFYYIGTDIYIAFKHVATGGNNRYIDNVFGPEITPEAPGAPTLVSPADGAEYVSTLPTFKWNAPTTGSLPIDYTVYCDTSTNPTTPVGTTRELTFTLTEPLEYDTQYYWTVKAENSEGSSTAEPFSFTTVEEGTVIIGDGTADLNLPIRTNYGYSYSQSIFLQSEINIPDKRIEKISYYWNGAGNADKCNNWTIYMGHTDKTAFTSKNDWIPLDYLTQVFTGEVSLPAVAGWIVIPLSIPFTYNNTNNLVIAVDENETGYNSSSYYFYCTNTPGNDRSIIYYNDTTNPDPENPPIDTYSNYIKAGYPNIMLQFGEIPSGPVLYCTPDSWDFGQTLVRTTKTKEFTITNTGGGTLSVSSIDIEGDYYRLTINPAPINLPSLESTTFTVEYAPLAAGHHSGTVTIENTTGITTVELVGDCYDPTIYDFPYMVDFTTWMPTNWSQLKYLYGGTPASGGSWAQDDWLNTATGNKAARLNIWGTGVKDWLITPPIQIPDTGYELKFDLALMKWGSNNPVTVGGQPDDRFIVAISDNPDMTSSTILREWNNTGSTYVYDNILNTGTTCNIVLSDYAGTKYIAFYGESTVSNGDNDLMVDNVTIREIPTGPVLYCTPTSLDFGEVAFGVLVGPKKVTVTNTGTGVLELNQDNTQIIGTGFAIDDFDFSLGANESGQINVYANATEEGPFTATLRITYGTQQCNVSLSATGLPEGIIVIGTGTEELGLPIDPYYRYSYSQSIFLQSEINKANRYIEKIYYYWNGAGAATNSNVWTIYLGHTDINEFANANAWIPITDFSVYNVTLDLSAGEGWVEINLDTPFYHTDQNLVIAVDENIYGYDSYPNVYFYCTSVETKGNRSISYADDSTNPDPTAPPAGTLVTGYPNIKLEFEEAQPPLPVELTSFTVIVSSENMVQISWVTQTETEMLGYYIYRSTSETLDDNALLVSDMIEALNTAEQHTYTFTDSEIVDSGTYYYWLQTVDLGGTCNFHGPVSVVYTNAADNPIPEIPKVTELRSIYPNPFNPVAYIPYSLAEESDTHFYVYNVKGQLLRHIYVGPQQPGYYQISWNGKDANGKTCGSGVYYIIMKAGKQTFQRKAVLMK